MIRTIALALLITISTSAAAQVTDALPPAGPRLKELATVSSDIVRIGDLVDNAGAAADIPVFRSPDLGYTGAVPVTRVLEALAQNKVTRLDTNGLSEVVVTRLSRAITMKDIEARIARALAGQYGFGDAGNISITFDREIRTIHVEPSATDELQVARLNVDPRTGQFFIALELPGSATARRLPLRFSGTAVETAEAAVLTRALNRGETVKASDVTTERRPKAELAGDSLSLQQVIGFSTRRALRGGAVLRSADLMKPEVIQRNETVTIVYEIPGVLLTVRGKALDAGAVGDLIGVVNLQSNRTVQATVTGPGRVSIVATSPGPQMTTASVPDPSHAARPGAQ